MNGIDWHAFWEPVRLSLQVSLLSSLIAFVCALVCAWWMTKKKVRGKLWIETFFMLPLVLPPTVVGFGLLVVMGRRGWIGRAIEWIFHQPILFTWWAAVVASVVVSFPLIYQTVKVGLSSVERNLEDAARSNGANEWQVFRYVTLPLSVRSLVAGYVLGFARALGEFGATLMVAGNIPGRTQTVPTAIYLAVDTGRTTMAWLWVGSMAAISFLLMLFANKKR